jgi:hypothetical protein
MSFQYKEVLLPVVEDVLIQMQIHYYVHFELRQEVAHLKFYFDLLMEKI